MLQAFGPVQRAGSVKIRGAGFSPEVARSEDASADRAAAGPDCDIIRCS